MNTQKHISIFKWLRIVTIVLLVGALSTVGSATAFAQRAFPPADSNDSAAISKDLFDVPKMEIGGVAEQTITSNNIVSSGWPSLINGDFEQGQYVGWGEYSDHGWSLVLPSSELPVSPHSGNWATWLGGEYMDTSYIYQDNIHLNTSTTLRLWYKIASQDVCGYDFGYVQINWNIIYTWNLCKVNNTTGWAVLDLNLDAYLGQTVRLDIKVWDDDIYNSNLFIDDVSLIPSWVGGVSITSDKNVVAVGRPHVASEVASYDGFASGSLTAYVPMLFKTAFGSYESALYVQNVDEIHTASITIKYYDNAGNLNCTKTDTIPRLSSKGYWIASVTCDSGSLPSGWVGGAVVTSDYPIVAVARPHVGGEVMTYNGFPAGSLSSYIPMLFNGSFGGSYNAAFYVQNVDGSHTATITIKYYDDAGNLNCTKGDTIAPLASKGYWVPSASCDTGSLPAGWVGGVVVTSDQPIVGVGRPHAGTQVTTYNGFTTGSLSSYVPMLFNNAFGSYNAAFYVQNVDGSHTATITIKYYDNAGNLNCTKGDTIAPLASKGYWVPSASCDTGSLPAGWVGGVVVTSDQPIVGVGRPHVGTQVTTYNGFTAGSLNSYLPMLFNNAFGSYNAAFYIQNTESTSANVTIKFYDTNGNLSCTRTDTIPALSTVGYWVPSVTCGP